MVRKASKAIEDSCLPKHGVFGSGDHLSVYKAALDVGKETAPLATYCKILSKPP